MVNGILFVIYILIMLLLFALIGAIPFVAWWILQHGNKIYLRNKERAMNIEDNKPWAPLFNKEGYSNSNLNHGNESNEITKELRKHYDIIFLNRREKRIREIAQDQAVDYYGNNDDD